MAPDTAIQNYFLKDGGIPWITKSLRNILSVWRTPFLFSYKNLLSKLKADFIEKKAEIQKMEQTDTKDMYVDDLNELKKKFK